MKKLVIVMLCLTTAISVVQAQDLIVLRNAEEIQAKVTSITPETVTYKRWSNLEGPLYTIARNDIFYIKYQNGEKDIMNDVTKSKTHSTLNLTKHNNLQKPKKINKPVDWSARYRGEVNLGYNFAGEKGKWDLTYTDNIDSNNNLYGTADSIPTILSRPVFETIHGVDIGPFLFVGAGVGVQYYCGALQSLRQLLYTEDDVRWHGIMLPIFANVKFMYPINDKISPYLTLSLGGSIACFSSINYMQQEKIESGTAYQPIVTTNDFKQKLHGGFYCDFGVGVRCGMVNLSVGLQHQIMSVKQQYCTIIHKFDSDNYQMTTECDEEFSFRTKINSFYIKVGINF